MTVRLLDASEVARILGTSRQIVAQLSATEPDFPPAVDDPNRGRRRWDRRAVEIWAASQPDMVWGWSPPKLAWPGQLYDHQIMSVAGSEADSLNHDFLGDVHLLLALLHPGCPGGAREALESFGLRLAEARQSVADELGHPETPRRHGRTLARGISVLERAHLKAIELRDEEVSSEHVLLALLDAWESTPAKPFLERDGVERTALAERVITLTESGSSVARDPAPSTVSRRLIHAAEVAGVLGVSRARVAELAAGRGFPDSELDRHGHRCWERRAIFQWAVAHPERGPLRKPLEPPAPAHMPARLDEIFRIASALSP